MTKALDFRNAAELSEISCGSTMCKINCGHGAVYQLSNSLQLRFVLYTQSDLEVYQKKLNQIKT
jgi:positive regulator of sigma E activity